MDYIISDLRGHFSYAYMTSNGYIAICIMVALFLMLVLILPGRSAYDKGILTVFYGYMFAMYSLTILMRYQRQSTRSMVIKPFDWYFIYKRTGNTQMMWLGAENVLIFILPGILLGILFRRYGRIRQVLAASIALGICSVTIELTQYYLNIGVCELDDLICNTVGALIGAGLSVLVPRNRY